MAKISKSPIDAEAIDHYLAGDSDFQLEIEAVRALTSCGFTCQHGGTYEDPKSGKYREFDVRGYCESEKLQVRLAVECKNIKEYSPMLVSSLPREAVDAYHEVICTVCSGMLQSDILQIEDNKQTQLGSKAVHHSTTVRAPFGHSIYTTQDPVGKSCAQIVRAEHDGSFGSSDGALYDKWSQAISSCDDLRRNPYGRGCGSYVGPRYTIVLPVLVVPDGCLWDVQYNRDGTVSRPPTKIDHASYFSGAKLSGSVGSGDPDFVVSHIEFVTLIGLKVFASSLIEWGHMHRNLVSESFIIERLREGE